MAAVPIAIMVASAAIGAVGAISSASANAASYKAQQQAANYNATVERQNAVAVEGAASANERAQRLENDQKMGLARARMAESGDGFVGTNVGVLAQEGADLELGALTTRYNDEMEARGMLAQSNLSQYQGIVAGENAGRAKAAGWWGAAASALGSASNYYNYRSLTMGGGNSGFY